MSNSLDGLHPPQPMGKFRLDEHGRPINAMRPSGLPASELSTVAVSQGFMNGLRYGHMTPEAVELAVPRGAVNRFELSGKKIFGSDFGFVDMDGVSWRVQIIGEKAPYDLVEWSAEIGRTGKYGISEFLTRTGRWGAQPVRIPLDAEVITRYGVLLSRVMPGMKGETETSSNLPQTPEKDSGYEREGEWIIVVPGPKKGDSPPVSY